MPRNWPRDGSRPGKLRRTRPSAAHRLNRQRAVCPHPKGGGVMRRASNPKYVTFGPTETVVTFATDRGQLRTNDAGEFFFRQMTDGRFTCASPDLERQLITAGVRAGQQ